MQGQSKPWTVFPLLTLGGLAFLGRGSTVELHGLLPPPLGAIKPDGARTPPFVHVSAAVIV